MSAESVAAALQAAPTPAAKLSDAILPAAPGFYGWWIRPGALPDVPTTRCAEAAPWEFLYVGIAPGKSGSSQTIRSRVTGNHLDGNAGSSTFRLSVASLLFERDGWRPQQRAKEVVLKGKLIARVGVALRRREGSESEPAPGGSSSWGS